jgi:serine/threonine protein kinase/tetratricopeptide (TPR) repeat protein
MSIIGKSIGHIRIEELVGRGGMGEVYSGYDDTLQRKVAVKAIAATQRLSPERKARFLREARALSRLEHPNICKIYDFIESENADFLILEFIEGRTLGQAIQAGIDKPDKLRIARDIAQVLAVAHGKGIVHRDLKPANIKLTPEGQVKVLDFGLARFLGPGSAAPGGVEDEGGAEAESANEAGVPLPPEPLAGRTMTLAAGPKPSFPAASPSGILSDSTPTEQGTVMGTPHYMSPEQARGQRATPASDMYSFGLILQELFTGRSSHEDTDDPSTLMAWAVKGETRPVTGLSSDLTTLINRLKSPVPTARPTAVETVERLDRIREKPKRRLRRLIASGVAAGFLLAGVKYTIDLGRERRQAIQARDEATNVVKFLVNLFQVSDPGEARGNTITAREVLDKGAKEIAQGLEKQPLTKARMMDTIGTVYRKLGLYPQSEPLVRGALDIREKRLAPGDLQVAESLLSLGALRQQQGQPREAKGLFQRGLDIRSKALPPGDPLIADAQLGLGEIHFELSEREEAEALYKKSLEIREKALGPDHPDVARSLLDLGWFYYDSSKFDEAERMYKRSLAILEKALGPDHPDVADNLNKLGGLCLWVRRYQESESYYRRALAIQEKDLGPDHPKVADLYDNIGLVFYYQDRLPEARANTEKALAIRKKVLSPDHPDLARCYFTLGGIDHRQGRFAEAERSYRQALAITERTYGPDSLELSPILTDMADVCMNGGRASEAEALYRRALVNVEKGLGPKDARVARYYYLLGGFELATGRRAEAKENFSRALDMIEKLVGPDSFRAAEALWGLSRCSRLDGKREEALDYLGRAEALCEKKGESDKVLWGTVVAERAWHLYHEDKDLKGAEKAFKKALDLIGSQVSPASLDFQEPAREYAALLRASGRADEARTLEMRLKGRDKSIP